MKTKEVIDKSFEKLAGIKADRAKIEEATRVIKEDSEQKRAQIQNLKAIENQMKSKNS